jgi:hypothetical protein
LQAKPYHPYRWASSIAISVLVGVVFIQLYPSLIKQKPAYVMDEAVKSVDKAERRNAESKIAPESPVIRTMGMQAVPARSSKTTQAGGSLSQLQQAPAPAPMPTVAPGSPASDAAGPASNRPQESEERLMMKAMSAAPTVAAKPAQQDDPQTRLKHILELLDEGKTAEAKKTYQAFKQQYPDYVIKPETARRLEKLQ